jgi:hypothetical protein
MCTTISEQATITGSGKQAQGWSALDRVCVGYDHPTHVSLEHAVLLDFVSDRSGSPERLAVELSLDSARQLAALLTGTIEQAEAYERQLDPVE